ncbi:hypothetical protein A3D76_03155 [Candidatus Roizmanbacteria bacterium RIFCSPHIGHO2_02_FULL_37_9b]|nr:MAG: hypothetical protein A3D76_03155 [Candidatus Roizmanbacteria bacterium RIFCSPHIGHO2_02_FULL_37_9b]
MLTLKLLQKLVSIPSVFPNEYSISKFVQTYLKHVGFTVKVFNTGKKRPNIVAFNTKAKKYLGFYGHLDTVPAASEYKRNPFKVIFTKNNKIALGLGVCDMKAGLTSILKTAEYAVRHNIPVKLVFGVDEENISEGAHNLVDSGLLNDLDFMVVAEGGQIKNYQRDLSLVFGRKGRIVFDIIIIGKIAHAAESQKGINAIEMASKLVLALKKINFKKHSKLGKTNIVIQNIYSEASAFSIPNVCLIKCSLLTSPLDNSLSFMELVKKLAAKLNVKIQIRISKRKTPYAESYEIPLSNLFIKKIQKNILTKYKLKPIYTDSVADENVFANRLKVPVLTLGAIGGGDHTASEWLDIDSLFKLIDVYKQILIEYNK